MFCSECGAPHAANAKFCSVCGRPLSAPASTTSAHVAESLAPDIVPATFWTRVLAVLVDGLITNGLAFLAGFVVAFSMALFGYELLPEGAVALGLVGSWLYFANMESSTRQATVGKWLMGVRVADIDGRRISFARASGRFAGRILSAMLLGAGFLLAAFTRRNQTLHDLMARTLVLRGGASAATVVSTSGETQGASTRPARWVWFAVAPALAASVFAIFWSVSSVTSNRAATSDTDLKEWLAEIRAAESVVSAQPAAPSSEGDVETWPRDHLPATPPAGPEAKSQARSVPPEEQDTPRAEPNSRKGLIATVEDASPSIQSDLRAHLTPPTEATLSTANTEAQGSAPSAPTESSWPGPSGAPQIQGNYRNAKGSATLTIAQNGPHITLSFWDARGSEYANGRLTWNSPNRNFQGSGYLDTHCKSPDGQAWKASAVQHLSVTPGYGVQMRWTQPVTVDCRMRQVTSTGWREAFWWHKQ